MLVNQNIQNTNFKSRIVVSSWAYREKPLYNLESMGKYVCGRWHINDAKTLNEGFSDGAGPCTIGFLKAKGMKKGYLFHLDPTHLFSLDSDDFGKLFEPIQKTITGVVENLRKQSGAEKPEVEGILTGGCLKFEDSILQYKKLMELFDNLKVGYSALLGQKRFTAGTNMHASVPKDEYTLELSDCIAKTGSKEGDHAELQKYFDVVKIRPEDTIELE